MSHEPVAPFLPALHAAWARDGRVSDEALRRLAVDLHLPLAEVYSVASFYHYPAVGEARPVERGVCRGPACTLAPRSELDEGLPSISCPGLCDRPGARYEAGRFFSPGGGRGGGVAPLPMATGQDEAIFRHIRMPGQRYLAQYGATGGYETMRRLVERGRPDEIIERLERSGLQGRGGAAFPTGTKWRAVQRAPGEPKYVVCNADEGEPGTFKDRPLLEYDPHRLLEGMAIAGYAVGAVVGIIYLRYEYPHAFDVLAAAIAEAEAAGILRAAQPAGAGWGARPYAAGRGVSGFAFRVELVRGAGSYVCGEETALLNSLEGRRPFPRERPPFPTSTGLWGRPTLVNNVETLAAVRPILEQGPEWFRGLGRGGAAGTKMYSVSGRVARPGNYELPLGVMAGELIRESAGGPAPGRRVKGFTLGGISGGLLGPEDLDLPLDYSHPLSRGCFLGSGGVIVLDESCCAVEFVRTCLLFYEAESCGKCSPCRIGTVRLREIFDGLTGRTAPRESALGHAQEIGRAMAAASACGLGQAAPLVVEGLFQRFADEVEDHRQGHCPAGVCPW